MTGASSKLREWIKDCLAQWRPPVVPTRSVLESAAKDVLEWKIRAGVTGIWPKPPTMITTTLDDGWGHGIQLIQLFAEAAGVRVLSLGLLQNEETVVSACREIKPELLGLTILQLDSEDSLAAICRQIPSDTKVVAGGPVFTADPDLAGRAGVTFVARNAADFWEFLLECDFSFIPVQKDNPPIGYF